jgi:hypothetical protein
MTLAGCRPICGTLRGSIPTRLTIRLTFTEPKARSWRATFSSNNAPHRKAILALEWVRFAVRSETR